MPARFSFERSGKLDLTPQDRFDVIGLIVRGHSQTEIIRILQEKHPNVRREVIFKKYFPLSGAYCLDGIFINPALAGEVKQQILAYAKRRSDAMREKNAARGSKKPPAQHRRR